MPVGLHLNLTLPFRDRTVPQAVRDLQEAVVLTFDKESLFNDEPRRSRGVDTRVRDAVNYQLEAFRSLYGEPAHIDGHHHIHVHPAVFVWLPPEVPIRPVIRPLAGLGRRLDARERLLRKRFRTADGCVSFRDVHTALGGSPVEALKFAVTHSLDVMVHAQFEDERRALMTREWTKFVNSAEVGSYRDLPKS
jgi:hypothetical protein